uniref:Uncharacterized protein n=1 Tax=Mycena chlorophos TaxID=658473 RepID=A0ABQ0LL93_MYCCL|nr:predicted protein [Mycena chlorophos]
MWTVGWGSAEQQFFTPASGPNSAVGPPNRAQSPTRSTAPTSAHVVPSGCLLGGPIERVRHPTSLDFGPPLPFRRPNPIPLDLCSPNAGRLGTLKRAKSDVPPQDEQLAPTLRIRHQTRDITRKHSERLRPCTPTSADTRNASNIVRFSFFWPHESSLSFGNRHTHPQADFWPARTRKPTAAAPHPHRPHIPSHPNPNSGPSLVCSRLAAEPFGDQHQPIHTTRPTDSDAAQAGPCPGFALPSTRRSHPHPHSRGEAALPPAAMVNGAVGNNTHPTDRPPACSLCRLSRSPLYEVILNGTQTADGLPDPQTTTAR